MKSLGKYYTPQAMAQIVVDWAISDKDATILDPCFGGCAFLYAALETLRRHGSILPGRFLFGVDCDRRARNYLVPLFEAGGSGDHFLTADFLSVHPKSMPGAPFHVICGNPPYVRHHSLSLHRIRSAREAMERAGFKISGRSSYWAYFVLHCLNFLRVGGSLAMILPHAFVYADYAKQLHEYVLDRFRTIRIISVDELAFKEAQEKPMLFLAKGFGLRNERLTFLRASSVKDARDITLRGQYASNITSVHPGNITQWNRANVRLETLELYDALAKDHRVTHLKDWATIHIGVVTGANRFFTLSQSSIEALGIPVEYLRPIITRASDLRGLIFRRSDYERLLSQDRRAALLTVRTMRDIPGEVHMYFLQAKRKGIAKRFKCRSRKPWYYIQDHHSQDAFLHYMSGSFPHIVLNMADTTCTNSIHRLQWSNRVTSGIARSLALSSATSLFQLSAELCGRSLGGGVLKLEPSAAQNLLLVACPATKETLRAFRVVDHYLRLGDKLSAVTLADAVLLEGHMGLSREDITKLRQAWKQLAETRLAGRMLAQKKVVLSSSHRQSNALCEIGK